MKVTVVGTGSKGNCYILEENGHALLIECGVPFKDIQAALNFDLLKVDACIISHEHKDHCKSLNQVASAGIPICASKGTFDMLGVSFDMRDKTLEHGKGFMINAWSIMSFSVEHDAKEPMGFIISTPEDKNILFITDTYKVKWHFWGWHDCFHLIMIEANYDEDMIQGKTDIVNKRRLRSHFSIQNAIDYLGKLDLSETKQIMLTHLSDGVSDERKFKQLTEAAFGIPTVVADKNTVIEL